MAESKPFEVRRIAVLRATLPNSRTAELKMGVMTVVTRSGEELAFQEADVKAMQTMFDMERAESSTQKS